MVNLSFVGEVSSFVSIFVFFGAWRTIVSLINRSLGRDFERGTCDQPGLLPWTREEQPSATFEPWFGRIAAGTHCLSETSSDPNRARTFVSPPGASRKRPLISSRLNMRRKHHEASCCNTNVRLCKIISCIFLSKCSNEAVFTRFFMSRHNVCAADSTYYWVSKQ